MIVKNLWRRKIRTFLTMLGIAVGVGGVISLSAFSEGFAQGFEGISSNSQADLTVGQKDAVMLLISSVEDEVGEEIRNIPGVTEVSGTVMGIVQIPEVPYFVVMGQDPKAFTMQHYKLIEGQMLTGRRQILLGKNTAETFKKKVGETFRINDAVYRVAGIYETGTSMEDAGAVIRLVDAQKAFDHRSSVNYFSVRVKDPDKVADVKRRIEEKWDKLAAVRSGESSSQDDMYNMYRSFGWFLGIFAALVGGLGMMNTSVMSVFERTREIGVLRAVGWSRWRVMGMIFGETMLLSLLAGFLGIALGLGLIQLASLSPAVNNMLSSNFNSDVLLQALLMAVILGALGGAYPAWRAAQLEPVEAMRYESGAGSARVRLNVLSRLVSSTAVRNLWRRPARTLITLLSIGIGVGFMVCLIAMTEGMRVTFNQLAAAGQGDLLAEEANTSDLSLSEINERTANRILTHPDVASISKVILGISSAPGLPYFLVFGVDLREDYAQHYHITEGRMLEGPREILVGRFAANGLKKTVGDSLRLSGTTYKVVGIYENGSVYEDAGGMLPFDEAQSLFNKPRSMSLISIRLKESSRDRIDQIARDLEAEFPDIVVSKTSQFTEKMQDFATMNAMLGVLVILTVVVGGIVMMNAMLMSVFERTQEIGVLRALGWRRRRIIGMVLLESLVISVLSTLIGFVIGVALNYLVMLEPSMGSLLVPAYSLPVFVQVMCLTVALGLIGGLYPAWKAAEMRPIEALRYE